MSVVVFTVDAEAVERVVRVVELDQHDRYVADHPRVMTGLDVHGLRRREIERAPVRILAREPTLRDEADVGVHALISADEWFDVLGPSTAHAVHEPFDARVASGHHVDVHATKVLVMRTFDRLQNRVVTHDANVPQPHRRSIKKS